MLSELPGFSHSHDLASSSCLAPVKDIYQPLVMLADSSPYPKMAFTMHSTP